MHGLCVRWEGGLLGASAAAVLGTFPPAPAGQAPDVALCEDVALSHHTPEGTPAFFHGQVEGHPGPEGFLLTDGHWRLLVEPDGRRIRGALGPPRSPALPRFGELTLFIALMLAARHHGLFHLHAAGLVLPGGEGLLVAGAGGAGKSTTTLSLLHAGLGYLGDDTLLLREGAVAPEVLAFPRPFHVAPRTVEAFPHLRPLLGPPAREDSGKWDLDAARAFPGKARTRLERAHLLVFPRVSGEPLTRALHLSSRGAFEELLASSALLVVEGAAKAGEHFALLQRLAAHARAFELHLGLDALADPSVVARQLGVLAR
jgi:hypothetical protein